MNTVTDFAFSYIGNNYIQPFLWLTNLPVACTIIDCIEIFRNKDIVCNSVLH